MIAPSMPTTVQWALIGNIIFFIYEGLQPIDVLKIVP